MEGWKPAEDIEDTAFRLVWRAHVLGNDLLGKVAPDIAWEALPHHVVVADVRGEDEPEIHIYRKRDAIRAAKRAIKEGLIDLDCTLLDDDDEDDWRYWELMELIDEYLVDVRTIPKGDAEAKP